MSVARISLLFVAVLGLSLPASFQAQTLPPEFFPVDAAMRVRVDFWKKVYTEITSAEAFLHDSEDLTIIYKKIPFQGGGRGRNRAAEREKREIAEALRGIVRKNRAGLDSEEARIFELVKHKSDSDLLEMARNVRKQQGLKDRYYEGLVRAHPYLDEIKRIFERENLPVALAFLPHVESSFNYRAYSKVGAAGMWQFMRSAARTYGLKMNYLVDERRDPLTSTRAAARFLRNNFAKLGAWPLAITAYNHGPVSINRAVETLGTRDLSHIIARYRNRRFGFASKNFYATFVATAEISSEPEKYFPNYPKSTLPPFAEITLRQSMTMDQIARATGIDKEALQDSNLALRPTVFRSNFYLPRNFTVRLPAVSEAKLKEIEAKFAVLPAATPEPSSPKDREHEVASGESLYTIAKSHNVEVADLIYLNGISQPSQIRPGMKLKLPEPGMKGARVASVTPAPPPPAMTAASSETGSPPPAAATFTPKAPQLATKAGFANLDIPEVKLSSRAPEPNWDEASVREAEIQEPEIAAKPPEGFPAAASPGFIDRVLGVFGLVDTDTTETKTPPVAEIEAKQRIPEFDPLAYDFDMTKSGPRLHRITVEVDETLSHYAEWSRTSPAALRRLNRIGAASSLRQGQKFLLPLAEDAAMEFHLQRIRFHQAIEEDLYGNYKVASETDYKIVRGDTIASICRKLDIPFWLLRKYQPRILQGRLAVGEVIRVPVLAPLRDGVEPQATQEAPESGV